ncbi:DUF6226 family protein [Streptomyces sp. VRA16 Mangrove soil]|uniref:DUF6226 family protein n=1 Tax=Streptomyces sp. VRA16 Mangrove soil TaxID=2817434 RepID=UPI001A9FF0EE|nr:DUF6226 family protein [Streptomyces sp. VRA16 Mangrove soil]MBO1330137.1 hypothetical protein [Streptomyces sp. VRA16 Mangrove soil]
MDQEELRRAVDEEFAVTGADTPPWPDPHPEREVRDEEYSRCLDPGKYRILAARADAWTRALCRLGLATADPVTDPAALWRRKPDVDVTDAVLLRPVRAGAMPLVFGFAAVDDVPRTVVVVGAGEPAVEAQRVPDCGCDACDDGSKGLLELLDEAVTAVVTGAFVRVDDGPGRHLVDTGESRSAHNWDDCAAPAEDVLAAAREERSPYEVVAGPAWD